MSLEARVAEAIRKRVGDDPAAPNDWSLDVAAAAIPVVLAAVTEQIEASQQGDYTEADGEYVQGWVDAHRSVVAVVAALVPQPTKGVTYEHNRKSPND